MKYLRFIMTLLFIAGFTMNTQAQFLKKLKQKAEKKIEREAEKRSEKRVNKGIDKGYDKVEDEIDGKNKSDKKGENADSSSKTNGKGDPNSDNENVAQETSNSVVWNKFDFIPGDEVIYEDGPSADEENGEFPSRWDLVSGQVEIAKVDGENVMLFIDGTPEIVPYLKNAKEDYLPEVFTIEFDFWRPAYGNRITVYLFDKKNQQNTGMEMDISEQRISEKLSDVNGYYPNPEPNWNEKPRWIHVSIAFTKGKLKVYMDDARLINIPHYAGNPTGLTLQAYWAELGEDKPFYFKNVRIAKGGVKYYDRVLSEGKIIVNGIKFDVNKATLKPESMGPINGIYDLMQKNPELNFSVEGHTDSDGADATNQTLSEARAKTVMDQLISMGISANRLKSTGFGESKPIDNNSTPEGKANNRRVEFVNFTGNSNNSNSTNSSSNFDALDKKTIATKLEFLPESLTIPISDNSGIVNGKGTIIIYATSDGNIGKMEITDVDKSDNYKLTVKYVTYNYNGSIHSQSNHLEIQGTFYCDLDDGESQNVERSKADFMLGRQDKTTTTIYATDESILRVYNN
mgnify:CR=1 FL=1